MVSVKLASGARLATLVAGMTVGEMTLLETYRSADVWADTRVDCLELSLDAYGRFREGIRKPASASSAISLPCWPASRSSPIGSVNGEPVRANSLLDDAPPEPGVERLQRGQ
jgi:hypothetical protein